MFFSQHFSFPLSLLFNHCSILIHSSTTHNVKCFPPALQFSPVTIIPPLLHTHSFIYHKDCIMFFSQHFIFPLSISFHHSSTLIHSSTTHTVLCFSPSTKVFPCHCHSTIPAHSFIHLPLTLCYDYLPVIQFSPVSVIPPLLHTHSFIYHPNCNLFSSSTSIFLCQYHSTIAPYSLIHLPPTLYNFFSQYLCFPLTLSFHHCSILIHSSPTHAV